MKRASGRRVGATRPGGSALNPETPAQWRRRAMVGLRRERVFFGHGYPDAGAEADALLAWAMGAPPGAFHRVSRAPLTADQRTRLDAALRRRIGQRLPVPYLTGEAWIGPLRFEVTPQVLIPRSFIGEWLLEGLGPWIADPSQVRRALDLCTGSGCLAILLALAFPGARVDASDVSPAALEVAGRNVALHELRGRVHPRHSDLFAALAGQRYNLIVSNPPYVDAAAMAVLPPEYRHEPALALAGGPNGLALVDAILRTARQHLEPGGLLVLEIGHNRAALEAAWPRLPFTWLETRAGSHLVCLLHREELPI